MEPVGICLDDGKELDSVFLVAWRDLRGIATVVVNDSYRAMGHCRILAQEVTVVFAFRFGFCVNGNVTVALGDRHISPNATIRWNLC